MYACVYQSVLLTFTPFPLVVEAHNAASRVGQQIGDTMYSCINLGLGILTGYMSGRLLVDLRKDVHKVVLDALQQSLGYAYRLALFHVMVCVLMEGEQMMDVETIDTIPGQQRILDWAQAGKSVDVLLLSTRITWLIRTVLFRRFDDPLLIEHVESHMLSEQKIQLIVHVIMGIFAEGLLAFALAKQANDELRHSLWMAKGEIALKKLCLWNEHCPRNFQNKV